MEGVSPTYYAAGATPLEFNVDGTGFGLIPDDAIGIKAYSNDNPLQFKDQTNTQYLYDIVGRTSRRMVLVMESPTVSGVSCYLGAIVSNDRQTVYWVNETRPLP